MRACTGTGFLAILLIAGGAAAGRTSLYAQGRKIPTPLPGSPQNPFPQMAQPQQNLPVILKIRFEDDRVTGDIRNAPIHQVLNELAARTGTVFEVSSLDNDPVTLSFFRVPLQEAIPRLLGTGNAIIYYNRDEAGVSRPRFVRVLARKNPNVPTSLLYIGTGAITKTGDDTVETPDQAIKALAGSAKLEVRQKAVEFLVTSKSEAAIPALAIAVEDTAPEVRVAAIEGLAALGARAALQKIVERLKDEHPGVRRSAIVAIALLGDAESLKYLKPMSRDIDSSVAAEAEIAIKKLAVRRP